jgi:redox-sensitive bicupin YhaK (pirin superfamily)
MLTKRPVDKRGHTQIGWLDSRHSFSFGDYHDPENMEFSVLRVINDDITEAGRYVSTALRHQSIEFSVALLALN